MNTKRQTVWLVSMLSLMVVLSAYYLFTEDVEKWDFASNHDLEGRIVTVETDEMESARAASGAAGLADESLHTALMEAQIVQQMQNRGTSGTDYFVNAHMIKLEELAKQTEQLFSVLADPEQSQEAAAQAAAELSLIEEQQARAEDLEDTLMKDYQYAIVTKSYNDNWKVTVQSDKLEKSQVVTILDEAIRQLSIGQDKISVQYVP